MQRIRRRLGFPNGIKVSSDGSKGGLCLCWKENLVVDLRSFNSNYIDVMAMDSEEGSQWRLMGFYGEPDGKR